MVLLEKSPGTCEKTGIPLPYGSREITYINNGSAMANLSYVTPNRLTQEANHARKLVALIGLPVTAVLSFMSPSLSWWFVLFFLIVVFNAGSIKRAGAKGEDKALSQLKSLPDSYTIFNQVEVPNSKSKTGVTELDFVVVGPNGLFVVEVKNNKGTIKGSEPDAKWVAHKVGQKGSPYKAPLGNPIKQVKRQVWALSNYTKAEGHRAWIESVVFFANHSSKLKLKGDMSVPVLHKTGLAEHIQGYQARRPVQNINEVSQSIGKLTA